MFGFLNLERLVFHPFSDHVFLVRVHVSVPLLIVFFLYLEEIRASKLTLELQLLLASVRQSMFHVF